MNFLLSTYACEPNKGSEPGVGWNWVTQLSSKVNLTVLTRSNNKETIDKENFAGKSNISFVYIDLSNVFLKIKKIGRPGLKIYYFLWQLKAFFVAKKLVNNNKIDLVHHITFNGISYPTFLWALKVKTIWGPVGGGQISPLKLLHLFGKNWFFELLRTVSVTLLKFNPLFFLAARNMDLLVAANMDTLNKFRKVKNVHSNIILETAVPIVNNIKLDKFEKPTILWAGELAYHKAPILALKAIKNIVNEMDIKLLIVGAGPLKKELNKFILTNGLENSIELKGKVPQKELFALYKKAHLFLFTSIRDTSGNVVLEAMANGLPCIVLDHQGVKEIVTDSCGVKIPISAQSNMVANISNEIKRLITDKNLCNKMAEDGLKRVEKYFTWDAKIETFLSIYENILKNENSTIS